MNTTPIEAGLAWAIQKVRRRPDGARAGGFPGAERILDQLDNGVARKRVGIRPLGRAPIREGAELVTTDGAAVGVVTSGGFGPSVNAPIAMGYVATDHASVGTRLKALVRHREIDVEVHRTAFIAHGYAR